MVEARELVTICRQIGGMLEAGVDILRVTRVVRAQTSNPRLLEAFGEIEHSLRVGASVSEALERVPDVFSPFAVSLVQEGEAKRDIAGAFLRIADFLQQEEEAAPIFAPRALSPGASSSAIVAGLPTVLPSDAVGELLRHAQIALLRAFTLLTVWLVALIAVWWSVEAGLIGRRWQNVALCGVTALFSAGAALWLGWQRRSENGEPTTSDAPSVVAPEGTMNAGATLPPRGASLPPKRIAAPSAEGRATSGISGNKDGENGAGDGQNRNPQGVTNPGTPLATTSDLATARQIARKRYGAMADAADIMSVQPDIYEMDLAETLNADDLESGEQQPESGASLRSQNDKNGSQGTNPARHENEADFD